MLCTESGDVRTLYQQHAQASGPLKPGPGRKREWVQGTHQGGGNLIICDGCWIR